MKNGIVKSKGTTKLLVAMSFTLLLFSNKMIAQNNWSLTVRGAANFTAIKLGDATLKNGFGGEATIGYQFVPKLAVYAGWGWNKFSADKLFSQTNIDVVETGYRAGLQFTSPFGESKFKYLIGAGGLYNHLEIENSEGKMTEDSGHGLGLQADVGIVFPLGNRCNLTPTVRYQALKRNLNNGSVSTSVDLNYFSTGLALSFLF
jgi:Outer membrane protein beta-barrel domain